MGIDHRDCFTATLDGGGVDRRYLALALIAVVDIYRVVVCVVGRPDHAGGVGDPKVDGAQFLVVGRYLKGIALNDLLGQRKHHALTEHWYAFAPHVPLIFGNCS